MDVTARWHGGYRATVRARQFESAVDEPIESGGDNTGMTPTELLFASLASCFALALAHVARKRRIALADLEVRATGEHDGPLRYGRIILRVTSTHDDDELVRLAESAVSVCHVSNTLRGGPEIEYFVGDVSVHRIPGAPG